MIADFMLKISDSKSQNKKKAHPRYPKIKELYIGKQTPQSIHRSAIGAQTESTDILSPSSTSPITEDFYEMPKLQETKMMTTATKHLRICKAVGRKHVGEISSPYLTPYLHNR